MVRAAVFVLHHCQLPSIFLHLSSSAWVVVSPLKSISWGLLARVHAAIFWWLEAARGCFLRLHMFLFLGPRAIMMCAGPFVFLVRVETLGGQDRGCNVAHLRHVGGSHSLKGQSSLSVSDVSQASII